MQPHQKPIDREVLQLKQVVAIMRVFEYNLGFDHTAPLAGSVGRFSLKNRG
jgi:hypothetical protein